MGKGFSLDFNGFLDLAESISETYGDEVLLYAAEQAIEESRKYVNGEILAALQNSPFRFDGGGYSQGETMESFTEISNKPTEVEGTVVTAYVGVDLKTAPQALILATVGSPHQAYDSKLQNAIKVKGKVRKRVDQIQKEVFETVLKGGTIR